MNWLPHSTDCSVCKISKGGRPEKEKKIGRGRPKVPNTIEDILNINPRKSIPKSIEDCISKVVGIKMTTSTLPNKSIQLASSSSAPVTLTPIPMPRKVSDDVAPRTLRKRSLQTKSIIQMMAGSDSGFSVQTAHVIKSLDRITRENIVKDMKIKTSIPAEHMAAMKATHNISWKLMRDIRRWLSTFNVQLSSEGKVREVAKEWTGKGLVTEYAPLIVKKGKRSEIVMTPWCYLFNLVAHVLKRLDDLKLCEALVAHKFIPENEIHVKIGGDHGGQSFKSSYQIANVLHPNKLENTVIFAIFTAKDSRANLRICLNRYKSHIEMLNKQTWSNKSFRVFLFGDYEYLCSMYGITGANGKHPCLFCTITSSDMQLPKGTAHLTINNELLNR